MLRRILGLTGVMVFGCWAVASAAGAQLPVSMGFEQIQSYDVDITIARNGDLRVIETIGYDFGVQERHGIDRDIPVVSRWDDHSDRIQPLKVESVTASEGTPSQYQVSDLGDTQKRIRIGDPDTTISGLHLYTITYGVRGALTAFNDHDELFWNAVGDGWSSPIANVTVRVHTPGPVTQVACYAGPRGSRLGCAAAGATGGATGGEATFSQSALNPFEGTTIVVALDKGVISPAPTPILREHWTVDQAFAVTPWTVGVSGFLVVAVLAVLGRLGWRRGRDRRAKGSDVDAAFATGNEADEAVPLRWRTETPVEFEPPDGIRPGQIGVLIDEHAHPLDATATIVDLAVRGRLRIEETQEQRWFRKGDWKLTRLQDSAGLLEYERLMLDGLFEDGSEVQLSELRTHFAKRLAEVSSAMRRDAVREGWFAEDPERTRRRWRVAGGFTVVVALILTAGVARFTHLGLIPLPLVLGGLLLTGLAGRMPSRTAKGTATLRRVEGFRRLIESPTEMAHAQFDERNKLFSAYLPFAIVFGCTEQWAKAFEGLDAEALETSWYRSPDPFTLGAFSRSINDFSTMTTGTVAASAPSSSGGSGFSGGSGGGGGGGGGGSW